MKRFQYYILLIPFLLTGCINDLLNTAPVDKLASGNMWANDYLTDLGMAGAYNPLRDGYLSSSGTFTGRPLYQFDRLSFVGQNTNGDALMRANATSGNGLFSAVWKAQYTGIHRCNDIIHVMPGISPSPDEKKARYIAEAKILRAYYYFRLNQVFKGVPVYLEPVLLDDLVQPRETEEQVWNVILNDLADALAEPALPAKYNPGDKDYGHVTKGVAYALRGKVYMYMKKYQEAINDFDKVAECGYGLFQGSYKELFKEANEQCEEMIFSIQHTNNQGYGSDTHFFCGTRSSRGGCWNNFIISPNLVDLYEYTDGTPFDWDDVLPGYKAMEPKKREVFFLRDDLTESEYTIMEGKGLDMSLYIPGGNEARLRKAYDNRDLRLEATVITPYATYLGVLNDEDFLTTSRWPYRSNANPPGDLKTDTDNVFYYLHRKFVGEGMNEIPERTYGQIDFPLIRYADVLLMQAEALAELDPGISQQAIALLNKTRARGGLPALNTNAATTVSSKQELIDRIRDERRIEFVNEGINYFDEVRWGTYKEKVFYQGAGVQYVWGENRHAHVWGGDHITTWAIPSGERQMNSNLTQNEGWGF